jgi:methionyl-tRNA formyltransferase
MRVLLAGEGHGFQALLRGFSQWSDEIWVMPESGIKSIPSYFKLENRLDLDEIASDYDYVITSGLRKKIQSETLRKSIFVNIHYAMFPKYRGMHSIVWALLNGDQTIGITIHEMDENFDSGPIIWQHEIVTGNKNSWELMVECDEYIQDNISKVMQKYFSKDLTTRPQDNEQATYVGKRNLEDCRISWDQWDTVSFERYLRALVEPYPLPFFEYNKRIYRIQKARVIPRDYIEINGHVVSISDKSVLIKIKGGLLEIFDLKQEDNTTVKAILVLNKIGIRLVAKQN